MEKDFLVFLDAGHGGVDAAGKYTTAPSKQFKHSKGTFHNELTMDGYDEPVTLNAHLTIGDDTPWLYYLDSLFW